MVRAVPALSGCVFHSNIDMKIRTEAVELESVWFPSVNSCVMRSAESSLPVSPRLCSEFDAPPAAALSTVQGGRVPHRRPERRRDHPGIRRGHEAGSSQVGL